MAFTTQIIYTISGTSDRNHAYGTIDTYSSTTINDSDVLVVKLNGVLLVLTTDYTVDDGVAKEIVLVGGLTIAANDTLVVSRDVSIDDPIVDWSNNTVVDADDLDKMAQQSVFKLQELVDQASDSVTLNIADDCWDGQGKPTCNFAATSSSTGLPTLAQVQDLLEGVGTATVDNTTEWYFDGTGAATDFILTDSPPGLTEGEELIVYVNNVPQYPSSVADSFTGAYTINSTGVQPVIEFTSAPSSGTKNIYIRAFSGSVATAFLSRSITGSSIALDEITGEHLYVAAGASKRVIFFGADGQPDDEDGRVITVNDIWDWTTGLGLITLDSFAVPTASIVMNSNQITGLTAGSSGDHAVNKTQMDAAVATASVLTGSAYVPVTLSGTPGTDYSNSDASAAHVVIKYDGSALVTVSVSHDSNTGNYVLLGSIGQGTTQSSMSFFVPSGGLYKFVTTEPDLVHIQTFS